MMQLNRLKNVFLRSDGSFRTGWKLFAGIAAYWIVFYAVFAGSAAIFGALFSGWGLTNDNLAYAPSWAQAIVRPTSGGELTVKVSAEGLAPASVTVRVVR